MDLMSEIKLLKRQISVNINIPDEVKLIISTLEKHGFEANIVGGCVRDASLGKEPEDWDICTQALPEQIMRCFNGYTLVPTGLKHGTITLVLNHVPFEITTYRTDGIYSDNRHPDKVEFVKSLKEDLSRRDFTINAMAYNPKFGFVDYFGGISDIKKKVIRCVGNADERFQEDALRILRALRFASTLGFSIEGKTDAAIIRNKKLLKNIAAERIASELNKLIIGKNVEKILLSYTSVIEEIIPEINETVGFDQNSPYHHLDLWKHTITSVSKTPEDMTLRLTMLLHDIAKPKCYTEVDSIGHYYGHPKISSDMARKILRRLKYDNNTISSVIKLILYHDTEIQPKARYIRKWLNRLGEKRFRQLIEIKRADTLAQSEKYRREKLKALDEIMSVLDVIIREQQCFSMADLAVDGRDMISIGVPEGAEIGRILKVLLGMVIEGHAGNDREELLKIAEELINQE